MKVFLDDIPLGDVPAPNRQRGEFFPRLVGVRVSSDGNLWTPLYIPLVRVNIRAGQVLIEINSNRPLVYITLQARRPFVNIFRFDWDKADYW